MESDHRGARRQSGSLKSGWNAQLYARSKISCIAPAFAQEMAVLHVQHPQGIGRYLTHTEGKGLLGIEPAASWKLVGPDT